MAIRSCPIYTLGNIWGADSLIPTQSTGDFYIFIVKNVQESLFQERLRTLDCFRIHYKSPLFGNSGHRLDKNCLTLYILVHK